MPEEKLLQYVNKAERLGRQSLEQLLRHARLAVEPEQLHFRRGEPSSVILEATGATKADVLVLGSVARNVPGLLMGNTADPVLRQVTCSVLTIKPAGFAPFVA